jgi:hypothetical protein
MWLLERSDGLGFVFEAGEEIKQADHLESLNGKFRGLQKTDRAACLLGGGEMPHQHADAAGINRGNLLEIENNLRVVVAEQFIHGGVKAVKGGAHAQAAIERDDFDRIHGFRVDIQRRNPLAAESDCQQAALTLQYRFVRVRGQLR